MSKLRQLKLHDSVVMTNEEMKLISGGSGTGSCEIRCASQSDVHYANYCFEGIDLYCSSASGASCRCDDIPKN